MDAVAAATPRFDNSYARLPERFHARQAPLAVKAPALVRLNAPLARDLGFEPEARSPEDWAQVFSGNALPEGAEPIAMAYAGHQFGQFVPQLGDGRALLIGEVVDAHGIRRDIQLKGSGRTPFSRGGDGRAALGPVLREYIVSEAMHALGVPTTRALAAVTTGERVIREGVLPGAVLTRVARGHIRVGTLQYFAAREDREALEILVAHTLERVAPERAGEACPALALIEHVAEGQARLVARWMALGFIHGVMNTDNTSLFCETIDYGPCAFMDEYHPGRVFSSIDMQGRYAYGNQPRLMEWNLCRMAETLLPLIDEDTDTAVARATAAVERFGPAFEAAWLGEMRAKLGLLAEEDDDAALATRLLGLMEQAEADFTLTFRALGRAAEGDDARLDGQIGAAEGASDWIADWRARLARDRGGARARLDVANPAVIPRNHRIERAIETALEEGDLGPFHDMVERLADPFCAAAEDSPEARPPRPEERVTATFCGT